MLNVFRGGGTAQVIVGGVVFLIILVFVLEFRAGRGSPTARFKQECAVTLSDDCVTPKDFMAAFRLVAPPGIEPSDVRRFNVNGVVLEGLVERELLYSEATRLGISIGEGEVDKELTEGRAHVSLPAGEESRQAYVFGLCRRDKEGMGCEPGTDLGVRVIGVKNTETQAFDYKIYERNVRSVTNRGPREFKEMQRREMIASRIRNLVRTRVTISEDEAFSAYARERSRATVRSALLKRSWFARFITDNSDAAIESWIALHPDDVDKAWKEEKDDWKESCPLVSEILVTWASEEDKLTARQKIDRARKQLSDGVPFERVARMFGDGDAAPLGGEIGCLNEKYPNGADELVDKIKALKSGSVSDVIETSGGFHIVHLEGLLAKGDVEQVGRHHVGKRLAINALADDAVRKYADNLITRVKAGEKLEDATRALSEQALASSPARGKKPAGNPDKAKTEDDPAANSLDRPKVEISAPFNVTGSPIAEAEPSEAIAAKVFQLTKPDELLPTPVRTTDGLAVVQLKDKELTTREDFDKVKGDVMAGLKTAKANDALAHYVAELKKRAGKKLVVDENFAKPPKNNDEDG